MHWLITVSSEPKEFFAKSKLIFVRFLIYLWLRYRFRASFGGIFSTFGLPMLLMGRCWMVGNFPSRCQDVSRLFGRNVVIMKFCYGKWEKRKFSSLRSDSSIPLENGSLMYACLITKIFLNVIKTHILCVCRTNCNVACIYLQNIY